MSAGLKTRNGSSSPSEKKGLILKTPFSYPPFCPLSSRQAVNPSRFVRVSLMSTFHSTVSVRRGHSLNPMRSIPVGMWSQGSRSSSPGISLRYLAQMSLCPLPLRLAASSSRTVARSLSQGTQRPTQSSSPSSLALSQTSVDDPSRSPTASSAAALPFSAPARAAASRRRYARMYIEWTSPSRQASAEYPSNASRFLLQRLW